MTIRGITLLCLLIVQLVARIGHDYFRQERDHTSNDDRYHKMDWRQLACMFVANGAAILFVAIAIFAIKDECA